MSNIAKGFIWASALILLAIANATYLIADQPANTLFVLIPVLAVITMRRAACCTPKSRA